MKISVIIPNYNNSIYIEKCIKSVLKQKTKNIEIIVIDDGSTDDSVKKINEIKKKSNLKITLIKQYNQNASIARNRGLELAKGEYIYFLDSDDEIFSDNTFNEMLDNNDDYDLLIGNFKIIDEDGNDIDEYINKKHLIDCDDNYKYSQLTAVPSNKLYKRKIIEDNNIYFSNVRIGQDLDFYLKYLSACKRIKLIDSYIYKYRIVNTSISRTINFNFLDIYNTMLSVKKYYLDNNLEDEYKKYIVSVAIRNFSVQQTKIKNFKERYIRNMIKKYFDFCYKSFKLKKSTNKIYRQIVFKYKIKRLLLMFKIYK